MNGHYDDIIHLPYPRPSRHPKMSMTDRAAQFSPFAALTGYDSAIRETGRLTEQRMELDEHEKAALDIQQRLLQEHLSSQPKVRFTCFVPDSRKSGGSYVTATGFLKKIDPVNRLYTLTDGTTIRMDDVFQIETDITP